MTLLIQYNFLKAGKKVQNRTDDRTEEVNSFDKNPKSLFVTAFNQGLPQTTPHFLNTRNDHRHVIEIFGNRTGFKAGQ